MTQVYQKGKMEKFKEHLDKFIPLYVPVSMVVGLLLGLPLSNQIAGSNSLFSVLNLVVVVGMVYPMMVGINMGEMTKSFRMWRLLIFGLIMGLVYPPIIIYLLTLLIPINSTLAFGLILAVVVPCSSMAIAYTGLSKGNTELATVLVIFSFILALLTVPMWLSVFGSSYHVAAPMYDIIKTLIIIVAIPMTLGYATRETIMLKGGKKAFARAKASFPAISLLGMYAIIFLIFMEKSQMIIEKWEQILIALAPLSLYYVITLLVFTLVDIAFKIKYKDHMALTFTATGKNEGTAMAIALGAGIGLAAIPAAITPLLQIPFLVTYMKMHWKIAGWFSKRSSKLVNEYELHEIEISQEDESAE
ncbi:MAG: arsenic resistance protein [Athalassotoga sp.]|uniref:arsenic resistance protein n=1 Tax=Athalassotoga sp. TaxID=2022597 RepID=UPI003CFE02CC